MTNHLKVVGEVFALCNVEDHLIGVVCKANDTQWQFVPLVKGTCNSVIDYIPLRHALEAALEFEVTK